MVACGVVVAACLLPAAGAGTAEGAAAGTTGQPGTRFLIEDSLSSDVRVSVDVASGNLMLTSRDLQPADDLTNLSVTRYYNSRLAAVPNSPLRGAWTLDVGPDVRIEDAGASATVRGPNGYRVTLDRQADGSYAGPSTFDGTLTREADGTWTLVDDGDTLLFDAGGAMTERIDGGEGRLTVRTDATGGSPRLTGFGPPDSAAAVFAYDTTGEVSDIDAPGPAHVHYENHGHYARIVSFTDTDGAITSYAYDQDGLLSHVSLPDGTWLYVAYKPSLPRGRVMYLSITRPDGSSVSRNFEYLSGWTEVHENTGEVGIGRDWRYVLDADGGFLRSSGNSFRLGMEVTGSLRSATAIDDDAYYVHAELGAGSVSMTSEPIVLRLMIDDDVVDVAPCLASGCVVPFTWDGMLGYNDFVEGPHIVKLVALDGAGNEASEAWRVQGRARPGEALFRSAAAPDVWRWATAGDSVQVLPDGRAQMLAADGTPLATLPKPKAVDANGAVVPSWYGAIDNVLILHVSHRTNPVAYPVTVAPDWAEDDPGGPGSGIGSADFPPAIAPTAARGPRPDPTGQAPGKCRLTAYPDPYVAGLGEFDEGILHGVATAHCKRTVAFMDLTVCIQKEHHFGPFPKWENEVCGGDGPIFGGFQLLRRVVRHDCRPDANRHKWRTYGNALVDDVDGESVSYDIFSYDRRIRC